MYRFTTCVAVILLLTALTASVGAYPSLNPWTGTGNLPTAELQEPGSLALAVDFLHNDARDFDDSENDDTVFPSRLIWGVSKHLEVGVGYRNEFSSSWLFAAKYQIESNDSGSIAVGALYTKTGAFDYYWDEWEWADYLTIPEENLYQLYAARTFPLGKAVSSKVNATIGANWTISSRGEDDENAVRLFASLQAKYGRGSFAFDWQTSDVDFEAGPMWSLASRYEISPSLKGQLGYGNSFGVRGGDETRFFGGLCFILGK